jgi:hypothetical protein
LLNDEIKKINLKERAQKVHENCPPKWAPFNYVGKKTKYYTKLLFKKLNSK